MDFSHLSPHKDVNEIIQFFTKCVIPIFEDNLIGIYLTGSLSYHAFNYDRSDIDLTLILKTPISASELEAIKQLHTQIEGKFTKWAKRLECSYTPLEMLSNIKPPQKPRPWYWGGDSILYAEAPYGNEWITNNYVLYNHAISLFGPDFKTLMSPVDIVEVQKACIRDLFTEWEPKKTTPEYFADSHYASYFILNLCRIFYTIMCQDVGSKDTASSWVQSEFGDQWNALVTTALEWKYGVELDVQQDALAFLDFVIIQISQTILFKELSDEVSYIRQDNGIDMTKVNNLRDVGSGINEILGHDAFKTGMFYRSGTLNNVRPEENIIPNVKTIINLTRTPDPDFGAIQRLQVCPRDTMNNYEIKTDLFVDWIQRLFTTMSDLSIWPLLIHCTAGKDRTGVAVALILKNLGVKNEAIVEEYKRGNYGKRYPESMANLLNEMPQINHLNMQQNRIDALRSRLLNNI